MSTIKKPEANAIAAALLTFFVFNLGHLIINGQTKKFVITLVLAIVGSFLCFLPGIVISILSVMDSYQTAERLSAGEEIPENEYTLPILYKICKIVDSSATCSKL